MDEILSYFLRDELVELEQLQAQVADRKNLLATLEAQCKSLEQGVIELSSPSGPFGRASHLRVELLEQIRVAKEAVEAAEVRSEVEIEAKHDPELRHLRARLAYCEELLKHGDLTQRQLVIQFTSLARQRFLLLQTELLKDARLHLARLEAQLERAQQSEVDARARIEAGRRAADEASKQYAEAQRSVEAIEADIRSSSCLIQTQVGWIQREQEAIQAIVQRRKIDFLVHFTPVQNLPSILQHGILPRSELEDQGISAIYPDTLRLDQFLGRISASISFPNYQMLYQKTAAFTGCEFCICVVAPRVLWERHCLFTIRNAAASGQRDAAVRADWSSQALEAMFFEPISNPAGQAIRTARRLPDHFTTNPQAEVLIEGHIPSDWIQQIMVRTTMSRDLLISEFNWPPGIFGRVRFGNDLFDRRVDWQHFQRMP